MSSSGASPPDDQVAAKLADALQDAVQLMRDAAYAPLLPGLDDVPKASLLQQCLDLCEQHRSRRPEPVRTLHHFACTGGTLISKCLAALPNVQLLSEVDPLSVTHLKPGRPSFAPTDMATLLRQSTRGTRQDLLIELFHRQISLVHEDALLQGHRLLIRDHAHSHFCKGPDVPQRPNFRALLPGGMTVRSVVTVRHPLESFAALAKKGWIHFEPGTLDDYCRRYMLFLDNYADVPVVRYEDFVRHPESTMQQLCEILDLRYEAQFTDLFSVFQISGDSGRTGGVISPRSSRPEVARLGGEAQASQCFLQLVARLGYGLAPLDMAC
jgi:hypothetical protein